MIGTCWDNPLNKFGNSQGNPTGGTKGERRSVTSQAPPLLLQRKPYLTGSPPSRQMRRCRQELSSAPSISRVRRVVSASVSSAFGLATPIPVPGNRSFDQTLGHQLEENSIRSSHLEFPCIFLGVRATQFAGRRLTHPGICSLSS